MTEVREELGIQVGDHVETDHGLHGLVIDKRWRAGKWYIVFVAPEDHIHHMVDFREVHRV